MMKSLLCLGMLLCGLSPLCAHAQYVEHDLHVIVMPEKGYVSIQDDIHVPAGSPVHLLLSADIDNFTMTPRAGRPHWIGNPKDRIIDPGPEGGRIRLQYDVHLPSAKTIIPQGIDNPGIYAKPYALPNAVFIPPSQQWHPLVENDDNQFVVTIDTPVPLIAVTSGVFHGVSHHEERNHTTWHVSPQQEPMALVVGPFTTQRQDVVPVPVQTFFLEKNAGLAPRYLKAAQQHLAFYNALFGPYAFGQYGIVENILPTGYGFPSFTLLGSAVLRLPFIPYTSLRHEIAHSWWGNGVLVDTRQGNWCEGLTTYVSDYLAAEEQSSEAATDYRLTVLRDFTELAAHTDLPLSRFISRTSPASRAIGYGKAMFVFHMLRDRVGHDVFYATLAQLYRDRLHRPTTWADIEAAFVSSGTLPQSEATIFFDQWLNRSGGPQLRIDPPQITSKGTTWEIETDIVQTGQVYALRLPYTVTTSASSVQGVLDMQKSRAHLHITTTSPPQTLEIDPNAEVFRVLSPHELGASVNTLKAADRFVVILASHRPDSDRIAATNLAAGLGHPNAVILKEHDVTAKDIEGAAILFFGSPQSNQIGLPQNVFPESGSTKLNAEQDATFIVNKNVTAFPHPIAILTLSPTISPQDLAAVSRKLPHYGKYARLSFLHGNNTAKSIAASASTLRVMLHVSEPDVPKPPSTHDS